MNLIIINKKRNIVNCYFIIVNCDFLSNEIENRLRQAQPDIVNFN